MVSRFPLPLKRNPSLRECLSVTDRIVTGQEFTLHPEFVQCVVFNSYLQTKKTCLYYVPNDNLFIKPRQLPPPSTVDYTSDNRVRDWYPDCGSQTVMNWVGWYDELLFPNCHTTNPVPRRLDLTILCKNFIRKFKRNPSGVTTCFYSSVY